MEVVVNDASVLIDLLDMDLFPSYLELRWELRTTDLIIAELRGDERYMQVSEHLGEHGLIVDVLDSLALPVVASMCLNCPGLSLEDCSVWFLAKHRGAILLTADSKLRKHAMLDGVKVHGSIFLVTVLHERGIINTERASAALRRLSEANPRAPHGDIDRLLKTRFQGGNTL